MSTDLPVLQAADFASDQDVRWCPGCGDYSILAQMKKVLADIGAKLESTVFISGIGCSSRFPYYVNTYGLHSIHGRAPAFATGLKATRPDLDVWVITGDGDALSIGGNHFLHLMRRNVDLNVVLFNNAIYGLTKGQYSPTSKVGSITKSTPKGSIDFPLNPISVAIAAEATFVARSIDTNIKHLVATLTRASQHRGTSFVEVYQNCNVFNDGIWDYAKEKETKDDTTVQLEHGKPLIFANGTKGIRLNGFNPEVVVLDGSIAQDDLLFHDERAENSQLAFLLSRMRHPEFPEPIGVFRDVLRPTYEAVLNQQIADSTKDGKAGELEALFNSGESWTVS
jgi:2-oxoglutarate ferredoxin oxidoreductase subunit beta